MNSAFLSSFLPPLICALGLVTVTNKRIFHTVSTYPMLVGNLRSMINSLWVTGNLSSIAMLCGCLHSGLPSSHFFFRFRHVIHPVLLLPNFKIGLESTTSVLFRGRPLFLAGGFSTGLIKDGDVKCWISNATWIFPEGSSTSSIFGLISSTSDSWVSAFDEDRRLGRSTGLEADELMNSCDSGPFDTCIGKERFGRRE